MKRESLPEATRPLFPSLMVFVLLAVVIGLAYANSLDIRFPIDDEALVQRNPLITHIEYVSRLPVTDYWAGARDPHASFDVRTGRYRPLVLLTYAFQHWWSGHDPVAYHAVNVLMHLAVSWLVYRLALRLGLSDVPAAAAAIVFALHPLHTEAVDMLVGRAELLMALGVLTSLLCAIRGQRWLSLTAFTVALFSKEQAVVLPALLALYHYCVQPLPYFTSPPTRVWKKVTTSYGWYIAVLGLYLFIRWQVLGKVISSSARFLDDPFSYLPWLPWLFSVIKAAGQYLWLCLWPATLSADYSFDSISPAASLLDSGVPFAILAWGTLFGLAVWNYLRADRLLAFCVGFMTLTFLPASNLFFSVGTPMAERLFYLPLAGLCWLGGLAGEILWRRSRQASQRVFASRLALACAFSALFSVITIMMIVRTAQRNRDWPDTETIAFSILEIYPNNAKAHAWIGNAALGRKEWHVALHHYQQAFRLYPDFETTDTEMNANLGSAFVETGRLDDGITRIERAVSMSPNWSKMHEALAIAYFKQGRYAEAEAEYRKTISLNEEDAKAYFGLCLIYLEQGHYMSALQEAESAIRWNPNYMEPRYMRARILEELGRIPEALGEYERVLQFANPPNDVAQRVLHLRAKQGG